MGSAERHIITMIGQTIYLNEESARKQVSMPFWAYHALKRGSEGTMTKGLVAYETLLLANEEYTDSFTDIEAQVDEQFASEVGAPSLEYLNKTKFSDRSDGVDELVQRVADGDPFGTAERVNVHLPVSLVDQIEGRGLGMEIAHGLAHTQVAPWSSRIERCEVKKQLIQFARGERVVEPHPFVEAVMEEDSSRWDIDPMLPDFAYDNWWESPDVTFGMISERGTEIKQSHTHRVPALQAAVTNADGVVTRSDVIDVVMEDMGVATRATAEKYADRLDFGESGGVEVDFVSDGLKEIAQMARDKMPDGHGLANLSAHELLLIDESVYDVDGSYPSSEDALEALESLWSMSKRTEMSPSGRAKANAAFYEFVSGQMGFYEE